MSCLTVEKLIQLKKEFDQLFPPRDVARDTAVFTQWLGHQYGFKIIPKDIPNDTVAVSVDVYFYLIGKRPIGELAALDAVVAGMEGEKNA